MNSNITTDITAGKVSSQNSSQAVDKNKTGEGLANLNQGEQITGTVVSTGEQVTIDFNGQQVTASKEVLQNAVPGEIKSFEVVKTSSTEIELRLLEGTATELRKTIKAVMVPDKNWETVLSQKELSAKIAEKDKQTKEMMSKLQEISTSFTENDCKTLEQEGFPINTMSVRGLYEAINRVKTELVKDGLKKEDRPEKLTGEVITTRLKEENLPVTNRNLSEINKALALSDTVSKMDDKAMKYLIDQDVEPTLENIYKAYYSGSRKVSAQKQELTEKAWQELMSQVKAVIQDAGYEVSDENLEDAKWLIENKLPMTTKTFSYKKELEEIKASTDPEMVLNQIVKGMKEGITPKDVTLFAQKEEELNRLIADIQTISSEAVTYAVQEGIDLTIKKLVTVQEDIDTGRIKPEKKELAGIVPEERESTGKVQIERAQGENIPTGKIPEEKQLAEKLPTKMRQYQDIPAETAIIDTDDDSVILQPETREETQKTEAHPSSDEKIEKESEQHPMAQDNTGEEDAANSDNSRKYETIRAQRLMEEIRLKMTLEAAQRLEKKGFSIETQKLEKVVEELRELEDSYYKKLLSEAEIPATSGAVDTLKATTKCMEQLKQMPTSILGVTLTEQRSQTIPSLLTQGLKLQAEYAKAGTAYETLMTVPNAEYGDSIRKAFANMDSLLNEMNIESTEQNQRAVRILGYNQMEITPELVEQVKAYDSEVAALINNLHPAVTVRMIKEGINPLNMTISELNTKVDQIKAEQGISSEEKFSTYLHRLEKEDGITAEERKAYIGIYRLLYNVEKSDGAALGAVIKADRDVTLSNLLTAVQTGRKGRVNAAIDDEFGTLTEMTRNKESIAEQLNSFAKDTTIKEAVQDTEQDKQVRLEEQTKYLDRILKQITEELSPEKLSKLTQEAKPSVASDSAMAAGIVQTPVTDSDVWDVIKDVPAEKLLIKLQQAEAAETASEDLHMQKVQQLRNLSKNSEQSIRFLNDFQVSTTPQNIMLANYVLSNGNSPIVKLLKQQDENYDEKLTDSIKELKELSDTINDKSSMNEAYESLEEKARVMLKTACSEETLDSRKMAELRSTAQQMSFLRTMASREFYQIPIETTKGITNINLTILRGAESGGKVSAAISSEQLGEVKADFSLKQQTLKGFISCDSRSGMEKLQANAEEIEKTAKDNKLILKQLDFGIQRRENDNYSYQNPENGQQDSSAGNQTERMLYRIAKAIVQTVRLAEDSEGTENRAVS